MYIKHLLFALATVAASATASGGNESAAPQNDPTVTRLVFCHGDYAVKHASSTATPTEIATAAMSSCSREMEEAADSTYQQALSVGLPLSNARETRGQFIEKMKDYMPGCD